MKHIPPATQAAVEQRSNGKCEECGTAAGVVQNTSRGKYITRLNLHHKRYWTGYHMEHCIYGRETPDDLQHVCDPCHSSIHKALLIRGYPLLQPVWVQSAGFYVRSAKDQSYYVKWLQAGAVIDDLPFMSPTEGLLERWVRRS